MSNQFWKAIYHAGIRKRNRKILEKLKFLQSSQHWSIERLKDHQLNELRSLLVHAHQNSEFYRKRFDEAGFNPSEIRHLEDLTKIPVTEKAELLGHRDRIQNRNGFERLFYSETSGSTGTPLVFFRSDDWDAWHNASVMRGYSWHDVSPWERNGYLWGFNLSGWARAKTRLLDRVQNRFRMFSYDDAEIRKFVEQLRSASYVGGYSSMIYRIAKFINDHPDVEPLTNLKMVKGTSEKIFPAYQTAAQRAFGQKIVSEYGAAEAGIIAFECAEGTSHINMETCIVETENDEILVTNLYSHSFPVIRYRLGDVIRTSCETCPCGREHDRILEVTGRVGQAIRGKSREYPSLTLYYVFKNLAAKGIVLNYAARQEEIGAIDLRIEQTIDRPTRHLLDQELRKYFGDDLAVAVSDNSDIRSNSKKFRDFVSTIE